MGDDSDPAIGFFTTRDVHAANIESAERLATDQVLTHWKPGGEYAAVNQGGIPSIAIEESFQIGLLRGIFGRKPSGYTFYLHE
ncbi:hypothetical protein [Pseudoxanthomonas sangjuensis]|uniref:hypothetical protein n=1 Tax=Pseudoxanthomonas sangjuensis TaxID=1503750 RepID=UPI001391421B|nr:hypothetical protein [Pseudoxanthomonas sangjuensis]